MLHAAAIVLAGGRSSRMGAPKAALDWHGSTLLRRVTGIVARAVDGPVLVVRAAGQQLPALPPSVEVVADARVGRGPMEGLAAGLTAIGDRATVAYLSSTDAPFLHPAFVRRVVGACVDGVDVVLPEIGGHRQPLAAAYRLGLLPSLQELIDADRLKPAFLYERRRVLELDDAAMLDDPAVAGADPQLASVSNVNEPADYERAHALPAPEISVQWREPAAPSSESRRETMAAWTLGELAAALPVNLRAQFALNGEPITGDAEFPLAAGDTVVITTAAVGG